MIIGMLIPAGYVGLNRWLAALTSDPAASPSGQLICSQQNYRRYMEQVGEVGEMSLGLQSAAETPDDFARLMQAFDRIGATGPQTTIISAYVPTGETYVTFCRQERCTMEEMGQSRHECLSDHMNGCADIALRFRGENYCLIEPPEAN